MGWMFVIILLSGILLQVTCAGNHKSVSSVNSLVTSPRSFIGASQAKYDVEKHNLGLSNGEEGITALSYLAENARPTHKYHPYVQNGIKKTKVGSVVENAGQDLYMVRSVVSGDGTITGSSVSVLSKENVHLNSKGFVPRRVSLSTEANRHRRQKKSSSKNIKHQEIDIDNVNYTGETLLMDEPDKSKGKLLFVRILCSSKYTMSGSISLQSSNNCNTALGLQPSFDMHRHNLGTDAIWGHICN